MNKKKKYSEEISDIMNTVPKFIVRWGISIIAILFSLIFTGAYFIQYPETVSSNVTLIEIMENNCEQDISLTKYRRDTATYIAICPIPEKFLGKINQGQSANIRLTAFYYQEYGILKGKVDSVFFDSSKNHHNALIIFPDGLRTSYGREIVFYPALSGTATIITQKRRMADTFRNPAKSFLKNR